MHLSIVTTLYHSASHILEFHERIVKCAKKITENYEIIFVNDGSPDESLEVVLKIFSRDEKVQIIDLSRNFGHHRAMLCGLAYANGDHVFLIDCDLEESPEWLESFYKQMEEENCDVIYGLQKERRGNFFERLSGHYFYKTFNYLCDLKTEPNRTSAMLMKKKYVEALVNFTEREPVFLGISMLTGFKQSSQHVVKESTSETTYSISKRFTVFINMLTSFSSKPLILIFYFGLFLFTCSLGYSIYLFMYKIFFSKPLDGWTSIMMSIWVLGGLIISFIGIIGIYLSKVFLETKQRPSVIIKETYNHKIL